MFPDEMKMIVAEHCTQYEPIASVYMSSEEVISDSCNNCNNFKNGRCVKNLYDEIKKNFEIK